MEDQLLAGKSLQVVRREIDDKGWEGILGDVRIERISIRVKAAQELKPPKLGKFLPRLIGTIAILLGVGAIIIDGGTSYSSRYSPGRYGWVALILGVILVVKPSARDFDF